MAWLLSGWKVLGYDPDTNLEFFGVNLLTRYTIDELSLRSEHAWFRAAVADVRKSMEIRGELTLKEVCVYQHLGTRQRRRGSMLRQLKDTLFRSRLRRRRGMVVHRDEGGTMYLTLAGQGCPRVLYEEVAHSLRCSVPVQCPLARKRFGSYVQNVVRDTPGAQYVSLPITCHLSIFRGILNGSTAYDHSSEEDRRFVERQVAELGDRDRCRLKMYQAKSLCTC